MGLHGLNDGKDTFFERSNGPLTRKDELLNGYTNRPFKPQT